MKFTLTAEADSMDELFDLFKNLKDRPINELRKPTKVTVELGDEPAPQEAVQPAEPEQPDKPATAPQITLEDLQRAVKDKLKAGGSKQHLREILEHYGAEKVSALDPKDYANVMQELQLVEA